jgi:D-alanyl-D-alanine carboxypeptidase
MASASTRGDTLLDEMQARCQPPIAFGHLWYAEAPRDSLVMLANKQLMRVAAARAFLEMAIDARRAGVSLIPAWVHRTHGFQGNLFVSWATREGRGFEANLRHVAPAGFSEHHTGYAVDIHEGPGPGVVEKAPFQQTRAYAWLVEHAGRHGFENSYPRQNVFGVRFEPWHWRWTGDAHAQATFATTRAMAACHATQPELAAAIQRERFDADAIANIDAELAALVASHVERLRTLPEP